MKNDGTIIGISLITSLVIGGMFVVLKLLQPQSPSNKQ